MNSAELADVKRIYRTITRQRTPVDADDDFVFSCRVLAGVQGVEEQFAWKVQKRSGGDHVHDDWASWPYFVGQSIHEGIERGLSETEGLRTSEEYISEEIEGVKVWSSLDIANDHEVIQIKTTEYPDPTILPAHIIEAGWEATRWEQERKTKVVAKVWKVYHKPDKTVGVNVHILTEEEKVKGYTEIRNRAKQCAFLMREWRSSQVAKTEQTPAKVEQKVVMA